MTETPDRRPEERFYQAYAAEHERRCRELERHGVSPEEAGYALLAIMGDYQAAYRSSLQHAPDTRD